MYSKKQRHESVHDNTVNRACKRRDRSRLFAPREGGLVPGTAGSYDPFSVACTQWLQRVFCFVLFAFSSSLLPVSWHGTSYCACTNDDVVKNWAFFRAKVGSKLAHVWGHLCLVCVGDPFAGTSRGTEMMCGGRLGWIRAGNAPQVSQQSRGFRPALYFVQKRDRNLDHCSPT